MCGIVGYVGKREALPILTEGLRRLEYRGYDSAGIAVQRGGKLAVFKSQGKVAEVITKLPKRVRSHAGIGHTRWATHGEPSDLNAHPHCDASGRIAIVHNGIIDNIDALRQNVIDAGITPESETDSELLAHLIALDEAQDLHTAVCNVLSAISGTYGLVAIDADHPEEIVIARNGSPVILGIGDGESLVASDSAALVRFTQRVVYLEDGEVARLTARDYEITSLQRGPIARQPDTIANDAVSMDKGDFTSYMEKEIDEQPECIARAINGRIDERFASARLDGLNLDAQTLLSCRRIKIIGCGSAYIAGLLGARIIERLTRLPVDAEAAAEFHYRNPIIESDTLYLVVSQSGETLDTLVALEEIQRRGGLVRGIVNVVGSTIARRCDGGIYLHAGPEISVVSTKTFMSTLIVFVLLALYLGRMRDMSPHDGRRLVDALHALPDTVAKMLARREEFQHLAEKYASYDHGYFIGRGIGHALALEGALKLKEISYIHAEAYPASELKHGPIALIDERTPTCVLLPDDELVARNVASIQEIRARRGPVLAISQTQANLPADDIISVPATHEALAAIVLLVPLQFLAFYAARARGCDVDQPRNLAKSVTVE